MTSSVIFTPKKADGPLIIPSHAITTLQPSYDKNEQSWVLEIFTSDSYITCVPARSKQHCIDLLNAISAAIKHGTDIDITEY